MINRRHTKTCITVAPLKMVVIKIETREEKGEVLPSASFLSEAYLTRLRVRSGKLLTIYLSSIY